MTVFLAYGFQRTTMDDIARAAELSRPGLYLQFRNKTDIYRALAEQFIERVLAQSGEILAGDGPLLDRVLGAVRSFMDLIGEIEEAPHGRDMLDMQTSLAGDIVLGARVRMLALMEDAFSRETRARGTSGANAPEPGLAASLLLDALDGMKLRRPPRDEQARLAETYARTIVGLLRA
jgi:AcrR family transcriptional regulator